MAIDLKEIMDTCHAMALQNKLWPDDEALWRSICREYSKTFSTPYHEVLDMDPEHVILAYFEEQLEPADLDEHLEKLLDMIYTLQDPEYEKQKKEELDSFIEQAEAEEAQRIKSGRPIHNGLKFKSELHEETKLPDPPNGPSQGFIDLSYLERESQEEGGFDE